MCNYLSISEPEVTAVCCWDDEQATNNNLLKDPKCVKVRRFVCPNDPDCATQAEGLSPGRAMHSRNVDRTNDLVLVLNQTTQSHYKNQHLTFWKQQQKVAALTRQQV